MSALSSTWGLEDAVAHRCIELIRRHAPRMMRAGGGGLSGEGLHLGKPVPAAVKRRMIELRRKYWTHAAIAEATGFCTSTVRGVCLAAGLPRFIVRNGVARMRPRFRSRWERDAA